MLPMLPIPPALILKPFTVLTFNSIAFRVDF